MKLLEWKDANPHNHEKELEQLEDSLLQDTDMLMVTYVTF